jgi:predicted 2-oxoglutarate/Fe(II)-dependent dioxygenase YbiX
MTLASSIDRWNEHNIDMYDERGIQIYDADEWHNRTCGADILSTIDENAYNDCLVLSAFRAMLKAEELFKCTLSFREPSIVRHAAYSHTPTLHADKHNLDGSPKLGMENFDISAVMYLNEDFTGGDLVFPDHGLHVSPSAGSIIIFPGDVEYNHYVDEVTSGTRWSSPLFFTIDELHEDGI